MIKHILLCLAAACLAAIGMTAIAVAQTPYPFGAFQVFVSERLGHAGERYQVTYLVDQLAPSTCLVAVTDTTTGHFAITAVPTETCTARRRILGQ